MSGEPIRVVAEMPPITRTQLALYGGASGDHNPIHIDIDFAKAAGFPDVFAHGMLVMGLAARAVTGVVPLARLKSYGVRFTAITQVHDRLTVEAVETGVTEAGDRRLDVTVRDQNGQVKVQGEALIAAG
ncbi:MAG: dehydratase [Tistrella sp.]|uniref:Dehydratase n=1 Tax=Tistrella mobilis TaxID=171437 RepID=A0A3B9ISF0_9PROT|nr:MaoC/PaaZ C-terminal domain-containing protein [Tistrella sp.]MAD38266.1 dehydratase [Tistrella sp.]MBA73843.1 dehydratase [Tistrella sp.]HAE50149.1 dehydratase [Tistrella mobilis]